MKYKEEYKQGVQRARKFLKKNIKDFGLTKSVEQMSNRLQVQNKIIRDTKKQDPATCSYYQGRAAVLRGFVNHYKK